MPDNIRPLSEQLEDNTCKGNIRLYYQADLIINKQDFNSLRDRLIEQEGNLDLESAIKRALEELADGVQVKHPDLRGIVSPKIFFTEPLPTGEEYCP